MTFIASVIARDGVAIVADSFATTQEIVADFRDLNSFLAKKGNPKSVLVKDLYSVFEIRPSYTRNYADKLVKFDDDTAITISGSAYVNGKLVKDVLLSAAASIINSTAYVYEALTIEQKLDELVKYVANEVEEHCKKSNFDDSTFIVSHYNRKLGQPQTFKIFLNKTYKDKFVISSLSTHINYIDTTSWKIVTAGQDLIADRLLFGSLYRIANTVSDAVMDFTFKDLKTTKKRKTLVKQNFEKKDVLNSLVIEDVSAIQLRELSLQEAVDLACLLMKIVMDLQVYTKRIPTVGGVIKLATINKEKGFQLHAGDSIVKPKTIY